VLAIGFAPWHFVVDTWKLVSTSQGAPHFALYRRAGLWIREHTAPEDEISYVEVGTIGYFGERRIRDLVGLVSPDALPFLERRDFLGAFRAHPTKFLLHGTRS